MKSKYFTVILMLLVLITENGYSRILLSDSFDYPIGALNGCNGGAGWSNSSWREVDADGDANVVTGLTFSDYPVSGNAAKITMTDTSGTFIATIANRYPGIDFPSGTNDLWGSFLYKQPGISSNTSRMAEIRCEDLTFRMRAKTSDSQGIAIGYDNVVNSNSSVNIQDGNTYLIISKFANIGCSSGGSATMWVLNTTNYNNIKSGGITETELNSNYVMKATDAHSNQTFGTSDRILLLVADASGTGFSAIFDELKYATTLSDVVESRSKFIMADSLLVGNNIADVYNSGGVPIDIAVGDFAVSCPGDEIAVIWDGPVSNVDDTNYYSIIIYDQNGLELDRCGRSEYKWGQIAAGNFLGDTGYLTENNNVEIAAVHSVTVGGYYPIYVFRKGFSDAAVVLQSSNTTSWLDITGGNFNTNGDDYDEIAAIKSGYTTIYYSKPSDVNWSATTTSVASGTIAIAAGNFDSNSVNGDEVAGISNTAVSGKRPIRLYKPGETSYYASAGTSQEFTISAIAAGDFDGNSVRDEIALASKWFYHVRFYAPGSSTYFKEYNRSILGVCAKSIAAGKLEIGTTLTVYDNAEGFTVSDYGAEVSTWGDYVVFLPSKAQTTNIPAFWINVEEGTSRYHSRTVPIVR